MIFVIELYKAIFRFLKDIDKSYYYVFGLYLCGIVLVYLIYEVKIIGCDKK